MRRLLLMTVALLAGAHACLAQVSVLGTTAMGLPSTPGVIQSSPLNGPSPFSVTTLSGAPDTTLAPVPLASDPTTPGTVVTCATPSGQITPGTPIVQVASMSAVGGTVGTTPSTSATPTISALPTASPASTTGSVTTPALLNLSAQPATSFLSTVPGTTIPVPPTLALAAPSLALPANSSASTPTAIQAPSTPTVLNIFTTGGALPTTISPTALMPGAAALGTIPTPFVTSATGSISPTAPLGSSSTTVCSSVPGGPPTNGAALPLSTPEIPASPPPGTIAQDVSQLGDTSIDPATGVMPTPNTSACAEGMTTYLSTPGTMPTANATGAAATPGVSSPSGC